MEPADLGLTDERMQFIYNLVGQTFELAKGFKVFPPAEVTDDPAVLKDARIVERLRKTKWWLRFADGREELLTLPELLVFTYNLIAVRQQLDEARQRGVQSGKLEINLRFAPSQSMTTEGVQTLLSKITLEGMPDPAK